MPTRTIRRTLLGVCAAAALLASGAAATTATATAAQDCPPPPPPGCQGAPTPDCPLSPYAAAVLTDTPRLPSYYWRLGDGGTFATDWMLGVGTSARFGTQVATLQPGAPACDADRSIALSGATPDRVWESHAIADPDGVRAAAAGREPFGIAIWVEPHVLDQSSRRIAGHELPAGGWFVAARDDRVVFSRYQRLALGTAWDTITLPRALPRDRWSFLVATYDAAHTMRLYVNGARVAQRSSFVELPPDPPPASPDSPYPDRGRLVLGASGRTWSASDPASQLYLEWDGGLDEAAFYRGDSIPTDADVARLWRVGTTGSDAPE